jgi:hypothetical protein
MYDQKGFVMTRIYQEQFTQDELRFLQGWQPCTTALSAEKDADESRRVGRRIRAASKQCFFNARKAILKFDDYAKASYIEGYAILNGFPPMEHSWVVSDGRIIDPTLPDPIGFYFAGLEFVGREGIEEFLGTTRGKECRTSPFLYAFGWGGHRSPSMARAYQDSFDYFLNAGRGLRLAVAGR